MCLPFCHYGSRVCYTITNAIIFFVHSINYVVFFFFKSMNSSRNDQWLLHICLKHQLSRNILWWTHFNVLIIFMTKINYLYIVLLINTFIVLKKIKHKDVQRKSVFVLFSNWLPEANFEENFSWWHDIMFRVLLFLLHRQTIKMNNISVDF